MATLIGLMVQGPGFCGSGLDHLGEVAVEGGEVRDDHADPRGVGEAG